MADVDLPSIDPPPGGAGPRAGGAKGALTHNVGPLPVWGWIAVLGVAGAVVIRRRRATAATAPDQVTYAQQSQLPTIGGAAGGGAAPIVSGGAPKATTNDQWRSQAVVTLTAKGYSSLASDTALAKYLSGASLDTTERALIDIALGSLGTPPSPPPAGQSAPTTNANEADDTLFNPNLKSGDFSGAGWYDPGVNTVGAGRYAYIPDQNTAQAIVEAGGDLYFSPSPGTYQRINPGQALTPGRFGTPLYQKVG